MKAQVDWSFPIRWTLWTSLGAVVGLAVSFTLQEIPAGNIAGILPIIGLLVTGAFVGIAQWHVLRSYFPTLSLGDWAGPTTIGTSLGWILPLLIGWGMRESPAIALFGILGGAILGFCQWLTLARYTRHAGWWIASISLAGAVMFAIYFMPNWYLFDQSFLVPGVLAIAAAALLTSPTITWLAPRAFAWHRV